MCIKYGILKSLVHIYAFAAVLTVYDDVAVALSNRRRPSFDDKNSSAPFFNDATAAVDSLTVTSRTRIVHCFT